jgi:FkbM family methyltransferase
LLQSGGNDSKRICPTLQEVDTYVKRTIKGQTVIPPFALDDTFQNPRVSISWRSELFERLVFPEHGAFLDVGANIGQTLLTLHLTQPKTIYFGFEPNLECLNYIAKIISTNSLQHHVILPIALAEKAKIAPLYMYDNSPIDQDATLIPDLRASLQKPFCLVSCFPFDAIRETLGIEGISFVKIDVEGTELEVISGMRKSLELWRPVILCEVLFSFPTLHHLAFVKERSDHLMQLLSEMHYQVRQIQKSVDHSRIEDAVKIDQFPAAYWTEENRHLCDYLFIPVEDEIRVMRKLDIST